MSVEYLVEVCLICCYFYRLPFIFITIYEVVCIQLAHLNIGDWKDISIAHVITIIKSEVSTFPIVFIFSVVVCLRCLLIFCHLLYIHSGKTGIFFSCALCSLWWVQIVGYVLACGSYSFVSTLHHLIIIIAQPLSVDIELIKWLSDIICRVCE